MSAGAPDKDQLVAQFVSTTSAEPEAASFHLEAAKWDLQAALDNFLSNAEEENDQQGGLPQRDSIEAARDAMSQNRPAAASSQQPRRAEPKKGPSRRTGMATLRDLRDDDEDDDNEKSDRDDPNLFAGGEKSAISVQDPNKERNKAIREIMEKAMRQGQEGPPEFDEPEGESSQQPFRGTGHRLGSEDTPSETIADPRSNMAQPLPRVSRTLTFWQDGISVGEDGDLIRYDDPANQDILNHINAGRAPLSLLNVQMGQEVEVHVEQKRDEPYKKKWKPFASQGNRLGSGGPSVVPVSSSTPTTSLPQTQPAPQQPPPPSVDASAPSTTLQIRLADGTRLRASFNVANRIQQLYDFVNASQPGGFQRPYSLQTTFPNRDLTDQSQTLEDAGLKNTVVVQKWT